MAKGFKHGAGGGASLNFKVVGGTSAPSNPKENTIWVNTDTEIRGWQFGVDNPNLLDFTTWANNISVYNGTKSVSGNAITLMSDAFDCHTTWYSVDTSAVIPCEVGKTYIFEWNHSGGDGEVYLFPNASIEKLVMTGARAGKIEYTAGAGVTFFTFRVGVEAANTTATFSNIRITEKDRAFDPGSVWISTGASSPVAFNALKKNNITVYPLSAKQYVGGAWVDKTAKSYQNGAWVDWWNGHLYEYGNLYEKFTGGWTTVGYKAKGYNCQAWFRDNHIEMYGTNGAAVGGAGTVNKMDLSGHTKLHILVDVNYADTAQLSVLANKSDDIFNAPLATAKLPQGTAKTVSLDISSVTEAYVAVGATSTIKVYDIWLE